MYTESLDRRFVAPISLIVVIASTLVLCVSRLPADDVESAAAVKPFQVDLLQSDGNYSQTDVAQSSSAKPIVYLLIPSARWDRPVARFMKTLDDKLPGYSATAEVRAIWLSVESDATKEYLPRVQQSLQLQKTGLGVYADTEGPEGWQTGGDVQMVAVVVHHGKVFSRFPYGSVNETDVPQVGEAVAKSLDKE